MTTTINMNLTPELDSALKVLNKLHPNESKISILKYLLISALYDLHVKYNDSKSKLVELKNIEVILNYDE